jgi:cell division protein FtsW (lipid II flippase)
LLCCCVCFGVLCVCCVGVNRCCVIVLLGLDLDLGLLVLVVLVVLVVCLGKNASITLFLSVFSLITHSLLISLFICLLNISERRFSLNIPSDKYPEKLSPFLSVTNIY